MRARLAVLAAAGILAGCASHHDTTIVIDPLPTVTASTSKPIKPRQHANDQDAQSICDIDPSACENGPIHAKQSCSAKATCAGKSACSAGP